MFGCSVASDFCSPQVSKKSRLIFFAPAPMPGSPTDLPHTLQYQTPHLPHTYNALR